MALDRECEIGRGHAAAIIRYGDLSPAAAIGEDVDPAGAGIDRVLDQFLDHARGTFDHLAGGDAVDDLFGKLAVGHEWIGLTIRELRSHSSGRGGKWMQRSFRWSGSDYGLAAAGFHALRS